MNNCNIQFKVKDFLERDMNYFRKRAKKIAYLVYKNPEIIELLGEFLLKFTSKIDFENKFKNWKKNIPDSYHLLYGQAEINELIDEIYKGYDSIKNLEHLNKFRGLIFENLMEIYYKNIYNKKQDKFNCGCIVIINGKEIIYNAQNCSSEYDRKTIDIAGYNKINSEFYELKVGPTGFNIHVISYLNLLNKGLHIHQVSKNINVGCMTLETKSKLKISLKINKTNFDKLELYGMKEIKELLLKRVS